MIKYTFLLLVVITLTATGCQMLPEQQPSVTPAASADQTLKSASTHFISPTPFPSWTPAPILTPTPTAIHIEMTNLPTKYIGSLPDGAVARLGQGEIRAYRFSPDNTMAAIGTTTGLFVFDTLSKDLIHAFPEPDPVPTFGWSADSQRIVAYSGGLLIAWDMLTGDQLFRLPTNGIGVVKPEWTPDGRFIVTYNFNGVAAVWDGNSGSLLHKMTYEEEEMLEQEYWNVVTGMYAALSPDGRTYATAYDYGEAQPHSGNEMILWDVASGQILRKFDIKDFSFYGIKWSPDGKLITNESVVVADIGIWNVDTGELLKTLYGGSADYRVFWSPDSSLIFAPGSYQSVVLNVGTGEPVFLTEGYRVYSGDFGATWSNDSTQITIFSWDYKETAIRSLDAATGHEVPSKTSSQQPFYFVKDYEAINLFDAVAHTQSNLLTGTESIGLLKWSPDGKSLASFTDENRLNSRSRIAIWDAEAEAVRFILESFDVPSWSADGAAVMVNGQAWETLTGRPIEAPEAAPATTTPSAIPFVTYSEDIAKDDIFNLHCQTVHVRLLGSKQDQYRLPESEIDRYGCYDSALISPDNRLLIVEFSTWVYQTVYGRDPLIPEGGIGIYNILTGQRVGWLNVESDHVIDIVFSPGGSLLASGSTDGTIILWDMTGY